MNDKVLDMESDTYFNKPGKVEHMEKDWEVDVQPVDINNAFVPVKGEAGNLARTQENIRKRFRLGGDE
jgi:hypothetical protein